MERTGTANLPLHPGKAPAWLYKRMVKMADAITEIIIMEYGETRMLEFLSNPLWFQSLACTLGYDWHSSGTTTVTTAVLKKAMEKHGIMAAGGKGMAHKTLGEIEMKAKMIDADANELKHISRMTAKVDSSLLQDGYSLYHHTIFFDSNGEWIVIQQGMNPSNGYARRYHWKWGIKNFVVEPHQGIAGIKGKALNMTAYKAENARQTSLDIAKQGINSLRKDFDAIKRMNGYKTLDGKVIHLNMPRRINWNALKEVYEIQPSSYEEMVSIKGVGGSTIRALAYISELIYGDELSYNDPVKFSFAVGGKDGVPYPVDRHAMDEAISILKASIEEAKLGNKEKIITLKKLKKLVP